MPLTPPPTKEQRDAIDYEGGNLLILACAGSGKTETLARRIARMIKDGTDRGSIVAFTFTDHAATELKHRIRQKLEENIPEEPSLGDMYVGTIHSYCLRVLRERDASYRRFEVMDEIRQAALIATNFVRFEDSDSGIGLDRLRKHTRSKTYGETLRTFLNTLNIIHQQQINVKKIGDPLALIVANYEKIAYKYPNYFLDFNKIIDELITFLQNQPDKLAKIREELTHVFVDEYQDVDDRQECLIRLLTDNGRKPLLTVVGDDDQALYGFRGAKVENILSFEDRYPNVKRVTLGANFRSTHAIVSIADEAVRQIPNRIVKEPVARKVRTDGAIEEHLACPGDIQLRTFGTEQQEAEWVAERIESLRGVALKEKDNEVRGLDYGDMAILLRSVRGSGAIFAETLRARGIPVVISGTGGLFNNDEVRLIQASFCLLARSEFALPDENGRFQLLSTIETREFVRKKIHALRENNRLGRTANSTRFLSWIDKTRADLDQRALSKEERNPRKGARIYPQAIFHEMLQVLGAREDGDEWPEDVMFNFGAFSSVLTQFEAVHQWITPARLKSLTLFLSNWATHNIDEGGINEGSALNSVKIMTVHAAKGLEWPVVFLPRISSYVFPSSLRTRGPDTFLPKDSFDKAVYVGGDDGERRLWYVAITRCAKFLNVSSLDRPRKKPTDYFNDIDHDCVSRNGLDPTHRQRAAPSPPTNAELLRTTYSDLATFWRCEQEYRLRALMEFSPGVGEQFGYGQQLHNILAEIHAQAISGRPFEKSEIRSLVEQRFHLRYTRGKPFEAIRNAAIKGLERYIEKFYAQVSEARAVEKPFELIDAGSGALISGIVDLLERGDPGSPPSIHEIVGLVDFKAMRIDTKERYDEFARDVSYQLQLYALGVKYAFSKEPNQAFAHIISPMGLSEELERQGLDERIPIDVSPAAREQVRKKVKDTVQEIRQGLVRQAFRRTGVNTGKCGRCDFRAFCPGYKEFKLKSPTDARDTIPEEDLMEEVDQLMEDVGAGSST